MNRLLAFLCAPFVALFLFLAGAAPAQAAFGAPYALGYTFNAASGNTVVLSTSADAFAGDTIVVAAQWANSGGTIDSVTTPQGAMGCDTQISPGGVLGRMRMCRQTLTATMPAASSITMQVSNTTTSSRRISAAAFSGGVFSTDATSTTGTSNTPSIATGALVGVLPQMLCASVRTEATSTLPITEPAGFTPVQTQTGAVSTQLEVTCGLASSLTSTTLNWGTGGSVLWAVKLMSFTEATVGTGGGMLTMGVGQ